MEVIPFQIEHLQKLRLQPAQAHCADGITDDVLEAHGALDAYTATVDGEVIAVAGLMEFWPGRAMAWSYIGASAGPHMIGLTRSVRDYLDRSGVRRIEAYVDPDFEAGLRWVELLGFELDAVLKGFLPDGRDQVLFSRVRTHG